MEIVQQIGTVIAVLGGLIGLLLWLRNKGVAKLSFTRPSNRSGARLESLDRITLTAQHSLHLVRVGDRALLIGLSPTQCNVLDNQPWKELSAANPINPTGSGATR
jgi:flagellar biogenesis protein FliO